MKIHEDIEDQVRALVKSLGFDYNQTNKITIDAGGPREFSITYWEVDDEGQRTDLITRKLHW